MNKKEHFLFGGVPMMIIGMVMCHYAIFPLTVIISGLVAILGFVSLAMWVIFSAMRYWE